MDPAIVAAATAVASAVSAGLVAGLTESAKQAIDDAYHNVKNVMASKYPSVDIAVVEARPEVKSRQLVLAEELAAAGAEADPDLARAVQELWQAVETHSPQAAVFVGVKLTRVEAGELEIRNVTAARASGVIAENVKVEGKFSVTDVHVASELPHPR